VYYPIIDPVNTSTTYLSITQGGVASYTFTDQTNALDGPATWTVWSSIPANSTATFANATTSAPPHANTLTIQTSNSTPTGETAVGIALNYPSPLCRQSELNIANVLINVASPAPTASASSGPSSEPSSGASPTPASTGSGDPTAAPTGCGSNSIRKREAPVSMTVCSEPTPTPSPSPMTGIDEMYVTQVAQFSKYTAPTLAKVPLVAGRQAELRVFLVTASVTGPLAQMPTVRVELNGALLANLPPPSPNPFPSGLPRSLSNSDEIIPKHSYNFKIPASQMTAGTKSIQAFVLDSSGNKTSITATTSVSVETVSPLIVTLVPLVINGKTGSTTDVGTNLVTKYWPFPSASYPTRRPLSVVTAATADPVSNDSLVLNQLEVARFGDGLSGFYYGLLPEPPAETSLTVGRPLETFTPTLATCDRHLARITTPIRLFAHFRWVTSIT
jgi:hypothetical protein